MRVFCVCVCVSVPAMDARLSTFSLSVHRARDGVGVIGGFGVLGLFSFSFAAVAVENTRLREWRPLPTVFLGGLLVNVAEGLAGDGAGEAK